MVCHSGDSGAREEGEKEHGGKNKKHKEVDFKKHKACMKKHKHDKSCE